MRVRAAKRYKLPLAAYVVRYFAPADRHRRGHAFRGAAGAGISGSSALIIALAAAFNKLTGTRAQARKAAGNRAEYRGADYPRAHRLPGLLSGDVWRRQRHRTDRSRRVRKPVARGICDDLNERVVLAYTGEPRNSGINNWEVMKAHIDGDRKRSPQLRPHRARSPTDMRQALEKAGLGRSRAPVARGVDATAKRTRRGSRPR